MLKAIYGNTQEIYISTLYNKFDQSKHYIHLNIPIYKKQEKFIHEFIQYTQETSYTQNGKQILHNGEYQSR